MAKIYVTLAIEAKDKLEAGATAKLIKENFWNVSDIDTISTEKPIQLDDICEKIEDYLDGEYSLDMFKENYRNKGERSCPETRKEAPEMVDLGLPSGTLWASCNLGANKPEEYGNFYAWGDTIGYNGITGEKEFVRKDYKFFDKDGEEYTKYNDTDELVQLESCDDAVTAEYGPGYCMPNDDDFNELIKHTTHEVTTVNGVKGMRFNSTAEGNNNSIFVPFAGCCSSGSHDNEGIGASLWSASRRPYFNSVSRLYCNQNGGVSVGGSSRYGGQSVRAVKHEK